MLRSNRHGRTNQLPTDNPSPQALEAIAQGKSYQFESGGQMYVFAPLHLGNGAAPWSMMVSFPMAAVLADANQLVIKMAIIGLIGVAVMTVVLALGIRKMIRPTVSRTKCNTLLRCRHGLTLPPTLRRRTRLHHADDPPGA